MVRNGRQDARPPSKSWERKSAQMQDIKQALYQRLLSDGTLTTLLGSTEPDPRVYSAEPPQQIPLSDATPAFITMTLASLGTPTGPDGVTAPDEVYDVRIWSDQPSVIESASLRLVSVLNGWMFDTTEHCGMCVALLGSTDMIHAASGRYCRKQTWRVWHIMDA